jgi:hypothetical protein
MILKELDIYGYGSGPGLFIKREYDSISLKKYIDQIKYKYNMMINNNNIGVLASCNLEYNGDLLLDYCDKVVKIQLEEITNVDFIDIYTEKKCMLKICGEINYSEENSSACLVSTACFSEFECTLVLDSPTLDNNSSKQDWYEKEWVWALIGSIVTVIGIILTIIITLLNRKNQKE